MHHTNAHSEQESLTAKLDGVIDKLRQMRSLLDDPVVSAVAGRILKDEATTTAMTELAKAPRAHGQKVQAAIKCIESMGNQPFTKADLGDKLRIMGFSIKNPKTALFYIFERLTADGLIVRLERGGGKRPSFYQKTGHIQTGAITPLEQVQRDFGKSGQAPRNLHLRGELEQTSFNCISNFQQSFTSQELVRKVEAAGFTFVASAERSIRPVLDKFVRHGLLDVLHQGDGLHPATYKRRDEGLR